ncbi:MAG: glutaredoxin family protein [Gammaproteobacteria bacterium]|nr:glutaredoxin family protein [Gammaproteobacteria bacterium]
MALALWRWRERYPFEVETIDIDEDPALEERLGEHVPALYCGEREVCRYRLDDAALLQYIAPGAKADD